MIEIMCTKFQRHNSEIRRFYANIFAFINAIHLVASFAFVLNVFRNAWILVKLLLFPKTPTISNCLCIFIVKPMLFCYLIECVRCFTMCMFFSHHQFSVKRFVAVVVMVVVLLLLILMFVLILALQLAQKARLSIIQKLNAENNKPKNSREGKSSMNKMHKRRKWAKVVRCGELMLIHAVHTMGKCFSLLLSTRLRFMLRFSLDELIQMNPSEKRAIN